MKTCRAKLGVLVLVAWSASALAAEPTKLPFDTYSGYFVSNKFEPDAKQSFVVISSQEDFDQIFGVAFVMQDRSHRLPEDAFKSNLVLVVKGGNAFEGLGLEKLVFAEQPLTFRDL